MDEISTISPRALNWPSEVSMEKYFDQEDRLPTIECDNSQVEAEAEAGCPNEQIDTPEPPPEYDALIHPAHLRHRFEVQPREDEGREKLPGYSSAISLETIFLKKMELDGAIHRAQDRNWYRVYATLQGTALTFHKARQNVFSKSDPNRKPSPDFPPGSKRGAFLRSYNLQLADVGIAADYQKQVL